MSTWTEEEVKEDSRHGRFAYFAVRDDGATYGTPTWIWSAVVENELYVRPHNGTSSRWYKAAMTQNAGRISGLSSPSRTEPHFGGIYFRLAGDSTAIGTRRRSSTQLQQANF